MNWYAAYVLLGCVPFMCLVVKIDLNDRHTQYIQQIEAEADVAESELRKLRLKQQQQLQESSK
jgi:hypothetical protein